MMELYHCVSARSFRPLWALAELGKEHGRDYRLIVMSFPPRVHQRDFLERNPLGTVPAFRDGALWMTESAAITQYLVSREAHSNLAVRPDESDYGVWLNALHYGEATLTFPQTLVLRYGRFESPERLQPQVVEDYQRWFLARLKILEPQLEQRDWLCAQRFTAADISVGYALMLADGLGLLPLAGQATQAYWQRLQARPGFQQALQVQAEAARAQGISEEAAFRA